MLADAPMLHEHVFQLVPKIHYGRGAAGRAGSALRGLGCRRALLVTDPGVLDAGVCDRVIDALRQAGVELEIFADVATNPAEHHVVSAVDAYIEHGADGLVGVGGGSAMDVAKSAALLISNGGAIGDYEDGATAISEPAPPLVLVPTTAGTGSEVVGGTIILDSARVFKMHIVAVPADVALCDPALTLTLPRLPTAASGLDALAHAIGAYLSSERQPLADAMALHAITTLVRALPDVLADLSDERARDEMMIGSLTAGISMKGGAAADHAFGHAVNAVFGVLHGVGVALFLADVMAFNLPYMPDRLARVAQALGVQTADRDVVAAGEEGIAVVRDLVAACELPSLRDLGVRDEHLPALVEKVAEDRFHLGLNPVPIDDADAARILCQVLREQVAR